MKQILTILVVVFAVVTLIAAAFTISQVSQESARLENDIQYRSSLLADGLKESVEPNFINKSDTYLQSLVERYANRQRIAGLAVVDSTGNIIAVSSSLPKQMSQPKQIAANVMDADKADGDFVIFNGAKMYVYAQPLHDNNRVVGALLVVQNASYIDARLLEVWQNNILRTCTQAFLISLAVILIFRFIFYLLIQNFVKSIQLAQQSSNTKGKGIVSDPLFHPVIKEFSHIQQSLLQARLAASEEAKASLEKLSSPWTANRLQEFIKNTVKDRPIFVVSNREPYVHTRTNGKISYTQPVSGAVSALEPIMQATGGTWIAYGSGNADKEVVDRHNTVAVPPNEPKYTLKRVWLTKEEEHGYYNGTCNEGLWPLCHLAHTRPIFRKENWEQYKKVNRKFADAILSQMKPGTRPIIFVQDFHLALVPKMIKSERPDATIAIFWHIPWPSSEVFSICPWKKELLDGILGSDIIGFHTQLYCNNFIETVRHELESLVDLERFSVTRNAHVSFVKPFPISTEFPLEDTSLEEEEKKKLLKTYGIKTPHVGLGVDRLEYTKGILERFKGIEIFLNKYPSYQGKFTFLQIAVPSRTEVKRYQDFRIEVEQEAERINNLFKKNNWKPIILSYKQHTHDELSKLYKMTNLCLVTPLDDGMNLVAKEFIAARSDEKGVLVLSEFTGASRQLTSALLVNPYNGEQTADTIRIALEMSQTEQKRRMRAMREEVKSRNVYLWSAEIFRSIVSLG